MSVRFCQLFCAWLLLPCAVCAQYTLRGVVRDSLTGTVLAGASVHLVRADTPWSTGSSAIADSSGAYRITGISEGRYLFGFVHPRLDSLGFDAVTLTIEVAGADSSLVRDLAVPAAATLVRSICGALPESTGLLFGKVMRADTARPVSTGRIVAEWRELALDRQPREWHAQTLVAKLMDDGRFTMCGVPTDVSFHVRAEALAPTGNSAAHLDAATSVSGTIDIEFAANEPALHRDFFVSAPPDSGSHGAGVVAGTSSVAGRVLDSGGRPVVGARLVLRAVAAADSITFTDSTGFYQINSLRGGTFAMEIDRAGLVSLRTAIDLRDGASLRANFSLRRVAQELAGVTVTARTSMEQSGFEFRRTHRTGFFRTAEDIAREGAVATSFVLLTAPMLMQWGNNAAGRPILGGPLGCTPLLFVDGSTASMPAARAARNDAPPSGAGGKNDPASDVPPDLDSIIPAFRIGAVEVYAPGEAPARFADPFGHCSSIVIWSKGVVDAR